MTHLLLLLLSLQIYHFLPPLLRRQLVRRGRQRPQSKLNQSSKTRITRMYNLPHVRHQLRNRNIRRTTNQIPNNPINPSRRPTIIHSHHRHIRLPLPLRSKQRQPREATHPMRHRRSRRRSRRILEPEIRRGKPRSPRSQTRVRRRKLRRRSIRKKVWVHVRVWVRPHLSVRRMICSGGSARKALRSIGLEIEF